ncbi:GNAT family N-acetyltransferase [Domibacillus indicus]|uniref:GNAT family N-acetyltransferase n=1 Tax=Domibacillus indicus TaxID=1437523 RepID=UPI0006977F27|nr:GNAT family N-acetyltransferase [Domibacillus indicus]
MLKQIQLKRHSLTYADRIFSLVSDPKIKEALGLSVETVDDIVDFLQAVMVEETAGKTVSRAIFNEQGKLIGVTSLMSIDHEKKFCTLGTWIGSRYWGKGYNEASKYAILQLAFLELGLEKVFIGTRLANKRSQQAQKKLPYLTWHAEEAYPEVHAAIEGKEKQPCLLNIVYRADFMTHASHFTKASADG